MSKLSEAVDRAIAIVKTVVGHNNVYGYTPYANTEAGIKAIMVDPQTKKVALWTVMRDVTLSQDIQVRVTKDTHTIVFRGWAGLTDAGTSEQAFEDLVETLRDTFRNNRELRLDDGTDPKAFRIGPIQVRLLTTGTFAGFLVHFCELTMSLEIFPIDYDYAR